MGNVEVFLDFDLKILILFFNIEKLLVEVFDDHVLALDQEFLFFDGFELIGFLCLALVLYRHFHLLRNLFPFETFHLLL